MATFSLFALFTMHSIILARFLGVDPWFLGVNAEGIGTVALTVSSMTKAPPQEIQDLVESIRSLRDAGAAVDH